MKLYTNNQGQWSGTQADARKRFKNDMRQVEVPVDKPNLLAFLNDNAVGSFEALGHKPEPNPDQLSPHATSWVSWALERLQHGQKKDAEEMLIKGLKIQKEMANG
ncbi:MAG: hypothetical protein ACO21T_12980 [Alphaproteobacteria bacterium]